MKGTLLFLIILFSPIWPLGQNPLLGDPFIIVNKKTNELAYINRGSIQQTYSIATGKTEFLTPVGKFTVVVKAKNPYYRKKDIPGGSKDNPLGTRWIGIDALETDGRIYGIHGTNQPDSIGKFVTNGCVRMQNKEVEKLFEEIPLGTQVLITHTDDSFESIAKQYGVIQ
ncbi:L,D-transpeptidase [Bacillus sp. FJAT-47783]|uniref:L,D-transpeptidase n=1 Tax=Bacillus sp. FJAT-47783 TaxID=2922712 RepID=UPI001FAB8FBA|nr:L,D-transpeptidase [Bacillus sp. FJAT-47783]